MTEKGVPSAPEPWIADEGDEFCVGAADYDACFTFVDQYGRTGNAHWHGREKNTWTIIFKNEGEGDAAGKGMGTDTEV